MPEVKYGNRLIRYSIEEKQGLKSHYISVEKGAGVVLKGAPVPASKADQLVLKKAKWILDKLELVKGQDEEEIATGSRIPYFGKRYYTQVLNDFQAKRVQVEFNHSQFKITFNPKIHSQADMKEAISSFYREKAKEKIGPRIRKWSKQTGLEYKDVRFMKLEKRWGSCTKSNTIILNIEAARLPYTLIDYVIVHELCHTKVKNHSKGFWAELSKYMGNWKELDERLGRVEEDFVEGAFRFVRTRTKAGGIGLSEVWGNLMSSTSGRTFGLDGERV